MQGSGNLTGIRPTSQTSVEDYVIQQLRATIRTVGEESWFILRPDVFAIPYLDGYLLYSPLQGLVLLITRAGLGSLIVNKDRSFLECLEGSQVKEDVGIISLFDTHPKQLPTISLEADEDFRPTSLTLSPTSACQLACTYCYIRGGDTPREMPWEAAEASIRFTVDNAANQGLETYSLEFHGQGEPTANWHIFLNSILLAEELCAKYGLRTAFSVVTNGILNDNKISFLADHNVRVGLSMDGFKKSMDLQRPLRGGGSTFDKVMQTIRSFGNKGVDFAIRSTVTPANLNEMKDFVIFVKNEMQCQYINYEPVCKTGRASDNNLDGSGIMPQFASNFREARDEGICQGVNVGFSACRIDGVRSSFCGAYGTNLNFCVSTEGLVSSCYEVLEESDPRADLFIYGRYDFALSSFKFYKERLDRLRNLNVTRMERCKDCYTKWNCGGDCLSKAALEGTHRIMDDKPLERCWATRNITKDELVRSLFRVGPNQ